MAALPTRAVAGAVGPSEAHWTPAAASPPSVGRSTTRPQNGPVGDLARGVELTSPELAERLSVSGTPEECRDKIRREIAPSGVNHMICAITDRTLVKAFTGRDLDGVADVDTQLRLIHDAIMPAFG